MAGQTQLIRVSFPTDVSGLNAATQAATQAQAATDALRDSAKKFGTDGTQAYTKFKAGIGSVKAELEKTKTLIELTSRSDTKRLNELIGKYKQLKGEIDLFNKKLNETNEATKKTTVNFGQLFTAVKLFLTAGLLKQTVDTALEMAKLAGNVDGVTKAFNKLPNSVVVLKQLQDATQGTVTDFELMQRALQAKNFRIPLEQLGKLFEFATVRAQQTGQSVDYLINSIVFGLGFQSIRRLDNVGISAAELRDVMKELGVSLNEAFNIVVQREVEKMGGLIKNTATDAQVLEANLEKVRQVLAAKVSGDGTFLEVVSIALKSLATDLKAIPLDKVKDAFTLGVFNPFKALNVLREYNKNIDDIRRSEDNLRVATNELIDVQKNLGETSREKADGLIKEISFRKENIRLLEAELEKFKAQASLNKLELEGNSARWVEFLKRRDELNAAIEGIGRRLAIDKIVASELQKIILDLVKNTATQLGLIEQKEAEIKDIGEAIEAAQSTTEIHNLNLELAKLNGELADLKAFGTTKQFLDVGGKSKLVPVTVPKGASEALKAEPLFKEGVKIPIEFDLEGNATRFKTKTRSATDQLQADIEELIDRITVSGITIIPMKPIVPLDEWDKFEQAFLNNQQEILDSALNNVQTLAESSLNSEVNTLDERLRNLKDFYDTQQQLAGDNEKRKKELRLKEDQEIKVLRQKRAEAEKKAALGGIIVNTALGIIKAIATSVTVYDGLIQAAIVAAEGVTQYAAASNARYYAKGQVNIKGPGSGTSDSINANISAGESVINAKSTNRSLKLLEGINTGKIDDTILNRLHLTANGVSAPNWDDSKIVGAIRNIPRQDTVKIASDIYEVKMAQDGFSKHIRRKNLG